MYVSSEEGSGGFPKGGPRGRNGRPCPATTGDREPCTKGNGVPLAEGRWSQRSLGTRMYPGARVNLTLRSG